MAQFANNAPAGRRLYNLEGKSGGDLTRAINAALAELQNEIASLRGEAGAVQFKNDIVVSGNRVCGVGDSNEPTDAISRGEAQRRGMYETADGHVAKAPVVAPHGVRVPPAVHNYEVPTLGQVRNAIADLSTASTGFVDLTSAQTITGAKAFSLLSLTPSSGPTFAGTYHNYSAPTSLLLMTPLGNVTFTGFNPVSTPNESRILVIVNLALVTVTLMDYTDPGSLLTSDSTHRINTMSNNAPASTAGPGAFILLKTAARWVVIATKA